MNMFAAIGVTGGLIIALSSAAAAQEQSAPNASSNAIHNPAVKSPDDMTSASLAKGQNSFTRAQAAARIRKAGYTNITGLTKSSDGIWHGQAMYDGKPVTVGLDYKGNVSPE
jgi:hypothetical protein